MKTVIKSQVKTIIREDKTKPLLYAEMKNNSVPLKDFKFYQKLLVVLVSLSAILIFPESPKEMEIVCKSYYPQRLCNVW